MKLLFSWCHLDHNYYDVKLGLDWYPHKCANSVKFPSWKGYTVTLYLIWWQYNVTYVSSYANYKNRMDYRYSDTVAKRALARQKRESEKK